MDICWFLQSSNGRYVSFCCYTYCNIDLRRKHHFARLSHILYTCSPWQYSHTIRESTLWKWDHFLFHSEDLFGMNITKLTVPNKTTLWGFEYLQRMTLSKTKQKSTFWPIPRCSKRTMYKHQEIIGISPLLMVMI